MRYFLLFIISFPLFCHAQIPSLTDFIGMSLDSKRFDQSMFENGFFIYSNSLDSNSNVYFLGNNFSRTVDLKTKPVNTVPLATKFVIFTPIAMEGGGNFMSETYCTYSELQKKYTIEQQQDLFLKNLLVQNEKVGDFLYVPGLLFYSKRYLKGTGYQKKLQSSFISTMYFESYGLEKTGAKKYLERELKIKCSYSQFQSYIKEAKTITRYTLTFSETKNYKGKIGAFYNLYINDYNIKGEVIFIQPDVPTGEGEIIIRI